MDVVIKWLRIKSPSMNSNSFHYLNLIFSFCKVKIELFTRCLSPRAPGMGDKNMF